MKSRTLAYSNSVSDKNYGIGGVQKSFREDNRIGKDRPDSLAMKFPEGPVA